LSGLSIYIRKRVRKIANKERRMSDRTIVIGCLGNNGCRTIFFAHLFTNRENLPSLLRLLRDIWHQERLSCLQGFLFLSRAAGSLSVSEVVDNKGRELTRNWGKGEPEREGMGVEVTLEAAEE
jgi:hypothetical protein